MTVADAAAPVQTRLHTCELVSALIPHTSSAYWWLMREDGVRTFNVAVPHHTAGAHISVAVKADCPYPAPGLTWSFDPEVPLQQFSKAVGNALESVSHRVVTLNGAVRYLLLWTDSAPTVERAVSAFPNSFLRH